MTSFAARFDAFHEQAMAATGLSDFGPPDYHEGLRRVLADYDRHARFSESGAQMTANELVGKLAGRLMAFDGFRRFPQYTADAIVQPIIVLGMPRTGTTALLRLLVQDPGTQGLELWLAAMPMPRPPRETWEANPLYRAVAEQFGAMLGANPKIQRIHPLFPDQPDECRFVRDQAFWSPGMATSATAPDYGQWCLETDARYAYRHLRRTLGLIAGGDTRRWVLKDPDHICALDAILDVFPDACIVQMHREPGVSVASANSLSWEILRTREPERTLAEHVNETLIYIRGLEQMEAIRAKADPARFFDLHIDELNADQVGCAERIHAHFGLPVSADARAAWTHRARQDPKASHGEHAYSLEELGLSNAMIRSMAPRYCERYDHLFGRGTTR